MGCTKLIYKPVLGVYSSENTKGRNEMYIYNYRFGYQGSEQDNDLYCSGNSYTTFYRELDPRLGRWMSYDPKPSAWESPFVSMGNNPISNNDILGDIVRYEKTSDRINVAIARIFSKKFRSDFKDMKGSSDVYVFYKKDNSPRLKNANTKANQSPFNFNPGEGTVYLIPYALNRTININLSFDNRRLVTKQIEGELNTQNGQNNSHSVRAASGTNIDLIPKQYPDRFTATDNQGNILNDAQGNPVNNTAIVNPNSNGSFVGATVVGNTQSTTGLLVPISTGTTGDNIRTNIYVSSQTPWPITGSSNGVTQAGRSQSEYKIRYQQNKGFRLRINFNITFRAFLF